MKVLGDLRSCGVSRVESPGQQCGERIGNVCIVKCRHKRERAPDVQGNVRVSIIMRARVATTNDQLVTTGDETHDPVVTSAWVPVEAEARLEIVTVTARDRSYAEARVVIGSSKYRIVELQ